MKDRIIEPESPRSKPRICFLLNEIVKKSAPILSVKIGVREFKIPVTELESPVSAHANKIAGIRFDIKPSRRNFHQYSLKYLVMYFNAIGSKTIYAKVIRKVPT